MIKTTLKKIFDIRDGELKVSFFMLAYIFLIIATLLIIKPVVNSLFISELGVESLPFAYLLVAVFAIVSSYFYTRATERFSLQQVIRSTLIITIISLVVMAGLLYLQILRGWLLYFFYVGVAIYAVLTTSQFWVLANLVFNVREAKRLFGFIGAGAITGGIFGGYLTTILAPVIGNENLIIVAGLFLLCGVPIVSYIWKNRVGKLNTFKQKKRLPVKIGHPFRLIKKSRHLTYLAGIIGIGVVTARLVDYQFSDIAAKKITDSDELTSFFGFWLSTFNVLSLLIQLLLTRKIVGVWGVGFSLLILPVLIFAGALLFFIFPELWVVILLKATDGSLKQSVNKSAVELLALPLPFELKNKTKSFIDVVVDSIATGIAGCVLILFVKGLDVPDYYITSCIIVFTIIWVYFVIQVRKEYFISFRKNLYNLTAKPEKKVKSISQSSFLKGMATVFKEGTEKEILFMLNKTKEINDPRFKKSITNLLNHPSNAVKAEALRNLYFLNTKSINLEIIELLKTDDSEVVLAALEYLLLHASKDENIVFDIYLDHASKFISDAALLCLAKESRGNYSLKQRYQFKERIEEKRKLVETLSPVAKENELIKLISIIGHADYKDGYKYINEGLKHTNPLIVKTAIKAAGNSLNPMFVDHLLELIENKVYRQEVTSALVFYGKGIIDELNKSIQNDRISLSIKRLLPQVISNFKIQESVSVLLNVFKNAEDLAIRLECIRALSNLKAEVPELYFDKNQVAKLILEECQLYDRTLNAMHTQIIIHYLKRKKLKQQISDEEMEARESLMELLERRLDAGLERIFKLLELHYSQKDVQIAYQGILSQEQEKRTNAIEFLDLILNPNLKNVLIPIVEATVLDTSSEEVIQMISKNRLTEYECFSTILKGKDLKLKLAILYLIRHKKDPKYLLLIEPLLQNEDIKIKTFAQKAFSTMAS
ncbi:hypothetical protein [Aquimarina sp. SS2-1]|uniref:hypothetical protein n=1 Tax=Aquimarina besae TaxID=3342247 RepID=UPI00366FA530